MTVQRRDFEDEVGEMASGTTAHCTQWGTVASGSCPLRRQPLRLARSAASHRIQHQFHSRGNSNLVEDAKQVLLYRVLAQAEFGGHATVAESVGDQRHHLLLARSEQARSLAVHYS